MICEAQLDFLRSFYEKGGQIIVRSLVFQEANRFTTSFWMQDISLVSKRYKGIEFQFYFFNMFIDN